MNSWPRFCNYWLLPLSRNGKKKHALTKMEKKKNHNKPDVAFCM